MVSGDAPGTTATNEFMMSLAFTSGVMASYVEEITMHLPEDATRPKSLVFFDEVDSSNEEGLCADIMYANVATTKLCPVVAAA